MKDYHLFTLRLEQKMYEEVRNLSHFSRSSIADWIREAINWRLEQIKKPLTNRDSAI